jgi:hypothetical protein
MFEFIHLYSSGNRIMIAYGSTPFGPIVFVFPFKYFFDEKTFRLRRAAEMYYTETASAQVTDSIPFFQNFSLGQAGEYAVKMKGLSCSLIRDGGGYVFNGFPTPGTIRRGEGFYGKFRRCPFGPFVKSSLMLIETVLFSTISGISAIPGIVL